MFQRAKYNPETPEQMADYNAGRSAYRRWDWPPDTALGGYFYAGWFDADQDWRREYQRAQREAGLDDESLDKLRQQLTALGFTIPN